MLDTTAWNSALKVQYPQQRMVRDGFYKDNPLVALMPKDTKFKGRQQEYAIQYAPVGGRSKTFANAQSNDLPTSQTHWVLTRKKDYSVASWDSETMLASEGNEAALANAMQDQMNSALDQLNRAIGIDAYRGGDSVRGVISAFSNYGAGTNNEVTLTNVRDAVNFEVNQTIGASPDASAGTPTVRTGYVLTSIDRINGKLRFGTTNLVATGSWAATEELFADGDVLAAAGGGAKAISGLSSWIPATAPTSSDSFFSVNRSNDEIRLAGVRLAYSGGRLDERLFELIELIHTFGGGSPDSIFLNWLHVRKLINLLGNQVERSQTEVNLGEGYKIAFPKVTVIGPRGPVKIYGDRNCPVATGYALDLSTWKFATLGAAPRRLDLDGNAFLRKATADGYEVRNAYFGNIVCQYPGANGVLTGLPTT